MGFGGNVGRMARLKSPSAMGAKARRAM